MAIDLQMKVLITEGQVSFWVAVPTQKVTLTQTNANENKK